MSETNKRGWNISFEKFPAFLSTEKRGEEALEPRKKKHEYFTKGSNKKKKKGGREEKKINEKNNNRNGENVTFNRFY